MSFHCSFVMQQCHYMSIMADPREPKLARKLTEAWGGVTKAPFANFSVSKIF